MVKKIEKKKTHGSAPEFETAQLAIDHLTTKGYERDGIWRYAKAARSWTTRDSTQWKLWKEVETMMEPNEATSE